MQSSLGKTVIPMGSLGILGGGQLGRFFTIAAQKMGYSVVVLDPDDKSPAGKIANKHICKPYDDLEALDQLKDICSLVTTEFENIPAETLRYLEKDIIVRPSSKAISIAQNRIKEKDFLKKCGMPVGTYFVIDTIESISKLDSNKVLIFPGILKKAKFGYDGKGQIHVNNKAELEAAFIAFNSVPCTLELKLDLDGEFSVVLARSVDAKFVVYPVIRNYHEAGILDVSFISGIDPEGEQSACISLAKKVANELSYIGVMAVEFFISQGNIFVNEIAPRPHNSGHFSIDACGYNQFDQQVLTLTGNNLRKEATQFPKSAMLNILGDLWFRDGLLKEPKFEMIAGPGVTLHLYGKDQPRKGRKMGHITILGLIGQTDEEVLQRVEEVRKILLEN
jgi:5-(carboxyamino)imidazole ribonucleotide synthase